MFRRRDKPALLWRVRNFVWPHAGWWRASKYAVYRVCRLAGSPWQVALGFGCGAFVSFTPLFGVHYLLSVIVAWFLRGNLLAAFLGANLGFFYPFIMLWNYRLGAWMLGTTAIPLPDHANLAHVLQDLWRWFLPLLVGSVPVALAVAAISFAVVYWTVTAYRRLRRRRQAAAAGFTAEETRPPPSTSETERRWGAG